MLNLCHVHRQEPNQSQYSEDNCDHCKALKKIKENDKIQKPLNHDYVYRPENLKNIDFKKEIIGKEILNIYEGDESIFIELVQGIKLKFSADRGVYLSTELKIAEPQLRDIEIKL